jgi:DNA helicase HerA-like ATPase
MYLSLGTSKQIILGLSPEVREGQLRLPSVVFTRGAVIVGKSGTGKSHDLQLITSQLSALGYSVVLLDRVGEHAEAFVGRQGATVLTPGKDLFFHVFTPEPTIQDPGEATEDVLDTISHYFAVSFGERPTPLQQRILRELTLACLSSSLTPGTPPSVRDFIVMIRRYEHLRRGVKGFAESCESLVSRLYPLTVGRVGAAFDEQKEKFSTERLSQPGAHIIDLSPLRYEPAKDLVSQIVVKQLYQAARRTQLTGDLRQLIAVDEAHHIAPREADRSSYLSFLDLVAIENRKFGQGVLVATTSPSQLSEALLRNVSVRVCHLLDDGKDIDLMLRFMANRLGSERYIDDIRRLQLGEAIVQVSSPVAVLPTRVRIHSPRPIQLRQT